MKMLNTDSAPQQHPPYSHDAEVAILGAILLNNQALAEVQNTITADDFYHHVHRKVFGVMLGLAARGEEIHHETIGREMINDGSLKRLGGPMIWNDWTLKFVDGRSEVGRVRQYAEEVQKLSLRREMIRAAQQIIDRGYEDPCDVDIYLAESRDLIAQLARGATSSGGPQMIGKDIAALHKHLDEDGDPVGLIKTGIEVIDRTTGGLWPGLLYAVAGRPSMGKSAFLINMATNVGLAGKKVLFVTLEDVRQSAAMRIVARLADIDLRKLMLKQLRESEQWRHLVDVANLMADKPIWFDDSPGLTSQAIALMAASHKAVHGLDLLIVDHLGEVADKGESETSIAGRAAMQFRDIAKELSIPVLMASQLNRQVESRNEKRPMLSDLRQSGRIEEAARVVWFLYRPAYYIKDRDEAAKRQDLHLIQSKASHGEAITMRLWADLSRMHVRSWDVTTDGPWPKDEKPKDEKSEY